MSRTYRFKKDKWRIKESHVLEELVIKGYPYYWSREWVKLDPKSNKGKKRLAEFHSDAKKHVMRWKGPMWFQHLFSQKPYRNKTKQELYKFKMDSTYEVQLLSKPHYEYYY